jgi:hypothetical protein
MTKKSKAKPEKPAAKTTLREKKVAQGVTNAHAAAARVREWGGALSYADLKLVGLGSGARRAVKMELLVRVRGGFRLNEGLTMAAGSE